MKIGLKIGVVALAMVATTAMLVSTGKVEAQENKAENIVKVEIGAYNSGQNTCTGSDYIYNFDATTEVQSGEKVGSISCQFGKSAQQAVTLQLSGDLTLSGNTSVTIPASGILLTNGTWTATPENVRGTNPASVSLAQFTTAQTLFNKKENTVGDASTDSITIKVIVPAGQADGTYNGTLILSYGG